MFLRANRFSAVQNNTSNVYIFLKEAQLLLRWLNCEDVAKIVAEEEVLRKGSGSDIVKIK